MPLRSRLLLFVKGLAMGAADVVPGVSGGTIAFITGIYDELINSIGAIGVDAVRVLIKKGPKQFWQSINGSFLLTLAIGIVLSVLTLARVVGYGLEHYPVLVWSFFFGLIVASVIHIGRQLGSFNRQTVIALIVGTGIALAIAFAPRGHIEATPLVVFAAGTIAISAMILPGISGSFILLLMGLYSQIIAAVSQLNMPLLVAFGAGCVCGLMAFSRLLSWLLHTHRQLVLALLTGFLIGSLAVVWPWKLVVTESSGQASNTLLLPWHYYPDTAFVTPMFTALAMMIVGFGLVLALEKLAASPDVVSH
ncbi:MAG: DUF368 domain-containing protein [Porticoccaceae bacterium]